MQTPEGWLLEPSPLPPMEHREIAGGRVVRTQGLRRARWLPRRPRSSVPPRSEVRLLLDQGEIVNAYPELRTSGGAGAVVRLTYAEALYDERGTEGKPQRDRREGDRRRLRRARGGRRDADAASRRCGGARGVSSSCRSGPASTPLTLEGLAAFATGFPLERRARFTSDDPELERIFDVSWRTMRLAAHETYMDAPYWEQLQYVGDTRIDALLNYTLAGEERLARRAIEQFDWSRGAFEITAEPLPHGRGPADPALRALLREHGPRLLDLPRRPRVRARAAAGDTRVARLVPAALAGRRPARLPALLDPRGHRHLPGRGDQRGGRPLAWP